MQRTKSLAMGVVGPRHQLGKTNGVVAVFPQHSKDSHTFQWHSRTLIPREWAQQLPHNSSEQLRLVEQQCQPSVPAQVLVPQGQGYDKAEEPHQPERRGHRASGSAPGDECTHLSQGCSRGSSGLQPMLYLLQTKSVCTENSPAAAV